MGPVVEIEGLRKHYGHVRALDGLDLEVAPGEVHGLVGPNGAGKSTTLRILLGLADPTSGLVRLFGGHPRRDAVVLHRRLAHVPGDVALWPDLTGGEVIDLLTHLRGLERAQAGRDIERLVERFDLDVRKRCRTYSKGNRQKVALVAALAGRADLLVLDEPTTGLDPLMEVVFQEEVRAARERGAAVLLSSHVLGQVEALVDRVSIVRDGCRLDTGTLAELRHLTRTHVDVVVTRPPGRVLLERLHEATVQPAPLGSTRVRAEVDPADVAWFAGAIAPLGVRSLTAHPATLEQILLRYYGGGRP